MQNPLSLRHSGSFTAAAIVVLGACGTPAAPPSSSGTLSNTSGAACPPTEPDALQGCTDPMQTCSYTAGGCTHTLRCVMNEWSFESQVCNFPDCPALEPDNNASCADPGLRCFYGGQPVPNEGPCVNMSWTEATCDPMTETWGLGFYDSVCPPTCPDMEPTAGDFCNPDLWPLQCPFAVQAACGAATQTVACVPQGNLDIWQLSEPVCGP